MVEMVKYLELLLFPRDDYYTSLRDPAFPQGHRVRVGRDDRLPCRGRVREDRRWCVGQTALIVQGQRGAATGREGERCTVPGRAVASVPLLAHSCNEKRANLARAGPPLASITLVRFQEAPPS